MSSEVFFIAFVVIDSEVDAVGVVVEAEAETTHKPKLHTNE